MDYLLVSLSVLGAGLAFGLPAPFGGPRTPDRWRLVAYRLVATVLMLVPGFAVADLFGPEGSYTSLWRMAVALWLPVLVTAVVLGRGAEEPA